MPPLADAGRGFRLCHYGPGDCSYGGQTQCPLEDLPPVNHILYDRLVRLVQSETCIARALRSVASRGLAVHRNYGEFGPRPEIHRDLAITDLPEGDINSTAKNSAWEKGLPDSAPLARDPAVFQVRASGEKQPLPNAPDGPPGVLVDPTAALLVGLQQIKPANWSPRPWCNKGGWPGPGAQPFGWWS